MDIQETKEVMEIMPRAFIYQALGGFTESLTHKEIMEKTKAIEDALSKHMQIHGLSLEVASTGKGYRLVFSKQA